MNKTAEIYPPGEFLNDELKERNWTQSEFAEIIGRPVRLVNEIVLGKKAITPETAIQFSQGLGTSPELWMNLESQYQLSRVQSQHDLIKRKAILHGTYPIREMMKRGWIEESAQVDILEKQCLDYFEIGEISEQPSFEYAAKSTSYSSMSILQLAWLFQAKKIASVQVIPRFSKKRLTNDLTELKHLMTAPEEIRHVVKVLNRCGVRLVVVEAQSSSWIY